MRDHEGNIWLGLFQKGVYFQPLVEEGFRHTLHDLRWDPAGNLGQVSTLAHDMGDIQSRFLFWTEDNRLHTVADDRSYSYYAYDHTGQRTLKMAGNASLIDQNAW
ncbi:hypothetical protein, partial [Ruminococcus flavefaciens]|uniref:hypothetical protein n=1 Tax=Ruminococcus flavefaciens TaxID=1265 RepID=UPI00345BBC65